MSQESVRTRFLRALGYTIAGALSFVASVFLLFHVIFHAALAAFGLPCL